MSPELYRELDRWTSDAAEAIGLPRVSIQDALWAMVRTCIGDQAAYGAVLARLRQETTRVTPGVIHSYAGYAGLAELGDLRRVARARCP